jgi:hypothetical protein
VRNARGARSWALSGASKRTLRAIDNANQKSHLRGAGELQALPKGTDSLGAQVGDFPSCNETLMRLESKVTLPFGGSNEFSPTLIEDLRR